MCVSITFMRNLKVRKEFWNPVNGISKKHQLSVKVVFNKVGRIWDKPESRPSSCRWYKCSQFPPDSLESTKASPAVRTNQRFTRQAELTCSQSARLKPVREAGCDFSPTLYYDSRGTQRTTNHVSGLVSDCSLLAWVILGHSFGCGGIMTSSYNSLLTFLRFHSLLTLLSSRW